MPTGVGCINFDKIIFYGTHQHSLIYQLLLALGFANICLQQSSKSCNDDAELSSAFNATNASDTLPLAKIKSMFILGAAEKILGEPAHLVDSVSTAAGDRRKIVLMTAYYPSKERLRHGGVRMKQMLKTKKLDEQVKLFFKIEQYPSISSAMAVYSYYKRSNETHPGFKERHDLGDEAWFGDSPFSIYVRKGNKIFGIKVNRPTVRLL
jgi:hypothetical protein